MHADTYTLKVLRAGALVELVLDPASCTGTPTIECLTDKLITAGIDTTQHSDQTLDLRFPHPTSNRDGQDLLGPDNKTIITSFHAGTVKSSDDVYLILRTNTIHEGDKLTVIIGGDTSAQQDVTVTGVSSWAWSITPAWVQGQKLTNGQKRDVGELTSVIQFPIFPVPHFRSYLTNTNLVSSDGKDKNTRLDLTYGFERTFSASDHAIFALYHPLQTTILSDQTGQNVSLKAGPGLRLLFPPVPIETPVLSTPIGPELDFDAQYLRRFQQDDSSKKLEPRRDGIILAATGSWTPIRILSKTGSPSLYGELNGYGWFLPIERNQAGKPMKRLEGRIEASLVIPVTALTFNGRLSPSSSDKPKTQIRFKFTDGADEPKAYTHSRSLSLGVETFK